MSEFSCLGNGISVYPNPVTDILHITGLQGNEQIQIADVLGKKISGFTTNNLSFEIKLGAFANAVYIVSITDSSSTSKFYKILKK